MIRGIRGAISVNENSKNSIFESTTILLKSILEENNLEHDNIISILITSTVDLNADFPAYAIRKNGLTDIPVLCATEIDVPGALKSVIRMLVHVNTELERAEIKHMYLGDAAKLRPDLVK